MEFKKDELVSAKGKDVGKPKIIKAEIVLLAMGFLKPEQPKLADNVFI